MLTVMKKLIPFVVVIMLGTSCTFYDVEPRYDSRDQFLGSYDVEEYSQTYDETTYYDMRISKSPYDREVYLDNFYAADLRIHASISFDNIRIPYQIADGYEIEGSGTMDEDQLSLTYRVTDTYNHTVTDYCETVAWR
jgi:hypothetical protein